MDDNQESTQKDAPKIDDQQEKPLDSDNEEPQVREENKDNKMGANQTAQNPPSQEKEKQVFTKAYMNNSLSTIEGDNSMLYTENPVGAQKNPNAPEGAKLKLEGSSGRPSRRNRYAKN